LIFCPKSANNPLIGPKKGEKMSNFDLAFSGLDKLTEDELSALKFTMPWQYTAIDEDKDPDGFDKTGMVTTSVATEGNRKLLQNSCWEKFNRNPHVNTAVRGQVGRLTGMGFEVTSPVDEVQEVLDEITYDPRNRLYHFWTPYSGRSIIEGELFLCLTVHEDGFVEVDFIDPKFVGGGGEEGIVYHPMKTTFPLFYYIDTAGSPFKSQTGKVIVPSINIAYFPEMYKTVKNELNESELKDSRSPRNKFNKFGGFRRFIVAWDKSFLTKRNVSYLRTVLEWLNHYENLKKYEIDHKKSAGSYLWVVTIEDAKSFKTWLALSDEDRRKTGIMAKKTPGSTLVLPPGMKMEVHNPKLPTISDEDTDLLDMVASGLNEPEDIMTGKSSGTFAAVKATRGPMSDRTSDEVAYFERFLLFDFWRAIFFIKSKVSGFPEKIAQKVAVDFEKKKPIFKEKQFKPEQLIEVSFPVSETLNMEARTRALLGVKHGSVNDTLHIPNRTIAKNLGLGNYRRLLLEDATERDKYPEPLPPVDAGGQQLEPGVQKVRGNQQQKPGAVPGKPAAPGKPVAAPAKPATKIIKRTQAQKQSDDPKHEETTD